MNPVIKLKQVDHVNHERSVLADVAGHPFITTLITSFSDHDSLYMLVGCQTQLETSTNANYSLITAPVARSFPTFGKRNASMRIRRGFTRQK